MCVVANDHNGACVAPLFSVSYVSILLLLGLILFLTADTSDTPSDNTVYSVTAVILILIKLSVRVPGVSQPGLFPKGYAPGGA